MYPDILLITTFVLTVTTPSEESEGVYLFTPEMMLLLNLSTISVILTNSVNLKY